MEGVGVNSLQKFRVGEGSKVDLSEQPTRIDNLYSSKGHYKEQLKAQVKEMSHLQNLLFAHDRYGLLLIFQAMDTAGKDGAIKHVMSGIDPAGCQVHSFKAPSPEELDHDFLWRAVRALPERGRIGIFNRSYYEEVLVAKVHPELIEKQRIPEELSTGSDFWQWRYESIRHFELHLHRNGLRILKFFLHLSREEQARRLMARIDNEEKNWKFDDSDIKERQYWGEYMKAYECCLQETSRGHAPWFVIPADDKPNARLLISAIILEEMRRLEMHYPRLSREQKGKLKEARKALQAEVE